MDFTSVLKKIYDKKMHHFAKIESLAQWYDDLAQKVLEYK